MTPAAWTFAVFFALAVVGWASSLHGWYQTVEQSRRVLALARGAISEGAVANERLRALLASGREYVPEREPDDDLHRAPTRRQEDLEEMGEDRPF